MKRKIFYLFILILVISMLSCCKNEEQEMGRMTEEEIVAFENIEDSSDIDLKNRLLDAVETIINKEFKREKKFTFYAKVGIDKINIKIYKAIGKDEQERIGSIFKAVKGEQKIEKELIIKFYRKENFEWASGGFMRTNEELLNTLTIK